MRTGYLIASVIVASIIIVMNFRMHTTQTFSRILPEQDVISQLHHLGDKLRHNGGESMQKIYPEGYIFTHVLYGLSWTEIARYSGISEKIRAEAISEAS